VTRVIQGTLRWLLPVLFVCVACTCFVCHRRGKLDAAPSLTVESTPPGNQPQLRVPGSHLPPASTSGEGHGERNAALPVARSKRSQLPMPTVLPRPRAAGKASPQRSLELFAGDCSRKPQQSV
jgi:hypothetical protein